MRLGAAGPGQRIGEARRALLQQGDVPGGGREQGRELRGQVAVDLDVGLVALVEAQQPRAPGAQARDRAGSPGRGRGSRRLPSTPRPVVSAAWLRNFLTGEELGAFELGKLLDRAAELKAGRARAASAPSSLAGRSVALDLRAALDPDADLLRGRRRRAGRDAARPARRRNAALARRVDRRHRRACSRATSTRS